MNTTAAAGRDVAHSLAPMVIGTDPDKSRRSMRTAAGGVLAGLVAIGVCVTLTSVASAQSAGKSTNATVSGISVNTAANLPAWPVLRQGSNLSWPPVTVRSLQYLLNAHGAQLVVDGIFGQHTDAAVRAFQGDHGLVVDGVVGEKTWSAVIITVRNGSAGPAVKVVQDQAAFRNLSPDGTAALAIDGIFGPRTEEWVRAFQTGMSFDTPTAIDGIVGPMTWQALIAGMFSD